ncbi:IS110 family transposase [Streptomyces spiralis]|uniref:IS110 family transposase n=1 Tax=Streptomyces spiralis TaxID=66376 RepID=UPI0033EAD158
MVVFGIDAHKRNHTAVAVDDRGRKLGERTTGTTSGDHLRLLTWAKRWGDDRLWAIEDCRQLSRRLERDLLAAGERIVRVPPKLMANCRSSARTYGKSDPIDALAVARAALREPDLPTASLDGDTRELRLLVDHRDDLVAERTRAINRLRWHLHELDPTLDPPARCLIRAKHLNALTARLAEADGTVARLARHLLERCRYLTLEIRSLEEEIQVLLSEAAPSLMNIPGCGALNAAKILGETAGITRFRSKSAYARHNGTAPLPVWSGNRERHRLARTGNRQLNAALHRIAITQAHYHPDARAYLQRRKEAGNTSTEAIRALRRRLSDVVYRALLSDAHILNDRPSLQQAA